ncbi:NeuD/PglB/VioB family sugar acetyltransferase [Gaetbulibacter aestuarii]|uniref:NeuD/PglB/VioB family sugar acetyltransferase n=1 Tax=Gaetbulibacter aestuarii TaxID=1502358 RepID=A0ABW7N0Q3_9FLAO
MSNSTKQNIVVFGASGHAKVIIDILEKQNKYNIIGLIDSFKPKGETVFEYEILGTEEDLPYILKTYNIYGGIIAIGDNYSRMSMYHKIDDLNLNLKYISAIHPRAIIGKNVVIGNGCCIMAGVVVNSDTTLGKHAILNTKCSVDHDCKIGDFSSIAPGATLGGGVMVDYCSAISLGASVIEGLSIGKNTIVGAGSLVLKSIGNNLVAYGVPAKKIRSRTNSEKYLGTHEEAMVLNQNYELKKVRIDSEEDILILKQVLEAFKVFNTFYSLEYCNHTHFRKLHYLVLYKNNQPRVLMPVFLKKIEGFEGKNEEDYFDVSSPYGFSGPLINKNATNYDLKYFWKLVDTWYLENNVVTEFIRFNLNDNHKFYSGHLLPTLNNVCGHLHAFETIWTNFKQKVRNNYRKALKNNLSIEIFSEHISEEVISSFYHIYIKTMVRNNASQNYFYSKSYFENLIKNTQNKVAVALIYHENNPISTELLIINDDIIFSFLGGTISEYFSMRPNDFLKIEVIKWAIENDLKYYALGGGRKNGDSLYQYKKSFFPNDDDVMFYTGRKIINKKVYSQLMKTHINDSKTIDQNYKDPDEYFPLYNKIEKE